MKTSEKTKKVKKRYFDLQKSSRTMRRWSTLPLEQEQTD